MVENDYILIACTGVVGTLMSINGYFLSKIYAKIYSVEMKVVESSGEHKNAKLERHSNKIEIEKLRDRIHDHASTLQELRGQLALLERELSSKNK
jgi:hypothetical protein